MATVLISNVQTPNVRAIPGSGQNPDRPSGPKGEAAQEMTDSMKNEITRKKRDQLPDSDPKYVSMVGNPELNDIMKMLNIAQNKQSETDSIMTGRMGKLAEKQIQQAGVQAVQSAKVNLAANIGVGVMNTGMSIGTAVSNLKATGESIAASEAHQKNEARLRLNDSDARSNNGWGNATDVAHRPLADRAQSGHSEVTLMHSQTQHDKEVTQLKTSETLRRNSAATNVTEQLGRSMLGGANVEATSQTTAAQLSQSNAQSTQNAAQFSQEKYKEDIQKKEDTRNLGKSVADADAQANSHIAGKI